MKKLYGLLALAGIAAGSAWGQDAVEADAIARAKALLHSASWSDKAWGAYFSTGLRSGELSDALVEEVEQRPGVAAIAVSLKSGKIRL